MLLDDSMKKKKNILREQKKQNKQCPLKNYFLGCKSGNLHLFLALAMNLGFISSVFFSFWRVFSHFFFGHLTESVINSFVNSG
jgi:hypothetical protein